ncbi:uncharacterized protein KY384_000886 [Bacidia gigantensis]|uniref:uncharacterized protein n=1 Tax=Bacidia gigantensis TaxID=2732470 RepID=UPI001D0384A2|nr:uncharacterized protein KY384_000886 [Bacidia gigantensis]KAG8534043.1 hypothetical protein KY384_000886 [Bacidia gigantensis]
MARPAAEVREPSSTRSSSTSSQERTVYEDDTDFFTAARNDSQSSLGPTLCDVPFSPDSEESERLRIISPISRLPPELLIAVFARLNSSADLRSCMIASKTWARNSAEMLWHRPLCNTWQNLTNVSLSIQKPDGYFPYNALVRRLNLSNLNEQINDGSVQPFMACKRIERLTLTGCKKLTDSGVCSLIYGSKSLLALDITGLDSITDHTLKAVAENCMRLQGLNITDCSKVTDESLIEVAENCHALKRLKLNNCSLVTDESILAVAESCPSMLEIDLHQCRQVTNASITALIRQGRQLRELRVGHCHMLTDNAFLELPKNIAFDSLRILDLTACHHLRDEAIEKIIDAAPRLRNLVLAKCREINRSSRHCIQITDTAVMQLVKVCNRIRYIDLACCQRLTDQSVKQLATLQKLRRIGLVKCQHITDRSIRALAQPIMDLRHPEQRQKQVPSLLERVHLSYCTNLTIQGIHALLNHCPKLTHLSLTGVEAFHNDPALTSFCREAPPEFTEHQRHVFCVFSGDGVNRLRNHLNESSAALYDTEGTMYDDRDPDADMDAEAGQVAGLMHATGINDDDEDMDEVEAAEGSQYGGSGEG